jgi:hypothetical protein
VDGAVDGRDAKMKETVTEVKEATALHLSRECHHVRLKSPWQRQRDAFVLEARRGRKSLGIA